MVDLPFGGVKPDFLPILVPVSCTCLPTLTETMQGLLMWQLVIE